MLLMEWKLLWVLRFKDSCFRLWNYNSNTSIPSNSFIIRVWYFLSASILFNLALKVIFLDCHVLFTTDWHFSRMNEDEWGQLLELNLTWMPSKKSHQKIEMKTEFSVFLIFFIVYEYYDYSWILSKWVV